MEADVIRADGRCEGGGDGCALAVCQPTRVASHNINSGEALASTHRHWSPQPASLLALHLTQLY